MSLSSSTTRIPVPLAPRPYALNTSHSPASALAVGTFLVEPDGRAWPQRHPRGGAGGEIRFPGRAKGRFKFTRFTRVVAP